MDAAQLVRNEEKSRLLNRLSEIMVAELREQGTFNRVPHFSTLEQAAHDLSRELSRTSQRRVAAEVATLQGLTATCPDCQTSCVVATTQRTVASLDGPVDVIEPNAYCSACRRAFFPSA